jgi:2-oxoglutarate dehydrogenase E2 component (dihydrolipoamide succinyltransferase)
MPTDVVMPQMGESIAEGTIVRWIKKVGDKVDRDEPLFEISTDKVDAEIPAPAAGVVTEIRHKEGETVPVNTIVAVIGEASESRATPPPAPAPPKAAAQEETRPPEAPAGMARATPEPTPQADGTATPQGRPGNRSTPTSGATIQQGPSEDRSVPSSAGPDDRPSGAAPQTSSVEGAGLQARAETSESAIRQRSSPLVRKIAKEHNIDITQLRGTGISGRVTKDDILGLLGREGQEGREGQAVQAKGTAAPATQTAPTRAAPPFKPAASDRVEKMSAMRKRIAEHMVLSRRTSAHVHSVFEVNFSRVAKVREAKKAEYEHAGAKLTFLSFILKAVVEALRAVPVVNASVDGDNIVFHKEVNLGIAVALDWGLIVPVIKNADEKNLLGLGRAVADLAARARAKQLKPEEVTGGTFTITNPGVFGALFGMPIINQPQVAILGIGNIEKRPVVIDDAIAIRPMGYLTLGYDHRLIDGAVADEFMSHLKHTLENWDPAAA